MCVSFVCPQRAPSSPHVPVVLRAVPSPRDPAGQEPMDVAAATTPTWAPTQAPPLAEHEDFVLVPKDIPLDPSPAVLDLKAIFRLAQRKGESGKKSWKGVVKDQFKGVMGQAKHEFLNLVSVKSPQKPRDPTPELQSKQKGGFQIMNVQDVLENSTLFPKYTPQTSTNQNPQTPRDIVNAGFQALMMQAMHEDFPPETVPQHCRMLKEEQEDFALVPRSTPYNARSASPEPQEDGINAGCKDTGVKGKHADLARALVFQTVAQKPIVEQLKQEGSSHTSENKVPQSPRRVKENVSGDYEGTDLNSNRKDLAVLVKYLVESAKSVKDLVSVDSDEMNVTEGHEQLGSVPETVLQSNRVEQVKHEDVALAPKDTPEIATGVKESECEGVRMKVARGDSALWFERTAESERLVKELASAFCKETEVEAKHEDVAPVSESVPQKPTGMNECESEEARVRSIHKDVAFIFKTIAQHPSVERVKHEDVALNLKTTHQKHRAVQNDIIAENKETGVAVKRENFESLRKRTQNLLRDNLDLMAIFG